MAIDRALIADTWDDIGGGPRAILACTTLAAVSASVAVGERLLGAMERSWAVSQLDASCGMLSGARIAHGPFRGLVVSAGLCLVIALLVVPFLVWFVVFVGLSN